MLDAAAGYARGVDPHLAPGLVAAAVHELYVDQNPLPLDFLDLHGKFAERAAVAPNRGAERVHAIRVRDFRQ
jgi:hypothetical protein